MVEMARELIGLGQLIAHVFDDVTSPTNLATDSAEAGVDDEWLPAPHETRGLAALLSPGCASMAAALTPA